MNLPIIFGVASLPGLFFVIPSFLIAILGMVFWIWMLVECATKESSQGNDKVVWILVIALTHFLGAAIYFLVRRPERMRELGGLMDMRLFAAGHRQTFSGRRLRLDR